MGWDFPSFPAHTMLGFLLDERNEKAAGKPHLVQDLGDLRALGLRQVLGSLITLLPIYLHNFYHFIVQKNLLLQSGYQNAPAYFQC